MVIFFLLCIYGLFDGFKERGIIYNLFYIFCLFFLKVLFVEIICKEKYYVNNVFFKEVKLGKCD